MWEFTCTEKTASGWSLNCFDLIMREDFQHETLTWWSRNTLMMPCSVSILIHRPSSVTQYLLSQSRFDDLSSWHKAGVAKLRQSLPQLHTIPPPDFGSLRASDFHPKWIEPFPDIYNHLGVSWCLSIFQRRPSFIQIILLGMLAKLNKQGVQLYITIQKIKTYFLLPA